MKLKRVLGVTFLLLLVLFIGFSSASCLFGPSDIIVRLSSQSNAHGELYSGSSYSSSGVDICYSSLFNNNTQYNGSNPHACSNPAVFWLSGNTNAHASTVYDAVVYSTPVCYGDLTCYVDLSSSPNTCVYASTPDPSAKVLVRLSNTSNAHLQAGSFSPNYPVKICCRKGGSYSWRDSLGNVISTIRLGNAAYATATNYNGQPDDSFDIRELDTLSDDNIISNAKGYNNSNDYQYGWTPTLANMTGADGPSDNNPFEFYFLINGKQSGNLDVRYCGDGQPDSADAETCDAGSNNGVLCTPNYGVSGCNYCNASCKLESVPMTFCGDNIMTVPQEECDNGLNNGKCTPDPITRKCIYCDKTTCKNQSFNAADPVWEDTTGSPITTAHVGDTVLVVYPSVASTFTGTFNVWEDDSVWPLTLRQNIIDINTGVFVNPNFQGYWKITQSAYDSAMSSPLEGSVNEFGFTIDGNDVKPAGYLNILPSTSSSNDPMKAFFTNLVCGQEINVNAASMNITFNVEDSDDLVSFVVKIDGVGVYGDTDGVLDSFIAGGNFTYDYVFSKIGTTNVRLEANNTRGELITDVANIIIFDPASAGTYIAACISQPKNYEHINTDFATFDARNSKAFSYNALGVKTTYASSQLNYTWKFSDGSINPYPTGTDERSFLFTKYFSEKKENSADLKVEIA